MQANKLLVIDNAAQSDKFLENYNSKIYKGWDIIVIGNPIDGFKFSNSLLEDLLQQIKDTYKNFMVIKSDSFFIKSYDLDLVDDVLSFPTVDEFGSIKCVDQNKNTIFLKDSIYYKYIKASVLADDNWKLKRQKHQYVNFLFVTKPEYKYEIDYVFPYVDSDDPIWYANYIKYKELDGERVESANAKDSRYESNYSTGLQRFRSNDMMKYVFRSIENNMPFIRKVHMIVATESQVPKWVNRDYVDIITHDEFIPKELLPTFSSSEIEMFLPNLPRVSEYFIYGNDDEFILKKQKAHHWFFDGKPVSFANIRSMKDNYTGDVFRRNDLLLTMPEDMRIPTETCLGQQHCPQPYVLSKMKECQEKYRDQILASCTRFREDYKNFNQWIFLGYNYFNGYMYNKKRLCLTTELGKYDTSIDIKKYTCVCMNDSDEDLYKDRLDFFEKEMEKIFPKKSKYEL